MNATIRHVKNEWMSEWKQGCVWPQETASCNMWPLLASNKIATETRHDEEKVRNAKRWADSNDRVTVSAWARLGDAADAGAGVIGESESGRPAAWRILLISTVPMPNKRCLFTSRSLASEHSVSYLLLLLYAGLYRTLSPVLSYFFLSLRLRHFQNRTSIRIKFNSLHPFITLLNHLWYVHTFTYQNIVPSHF